jgi:hypothetical protein
MAMNVWEISIRLKIQTAGKAFMTAVFMEKSSVHKIYFSVWVND